MILSIFDFFYAPKYLHIENEPKKKEEEDERSQHIARSAVFLRYFDNCCCCCIAAGACRQPNKQNEHTWIAITRSADVRCASEIGLTGILMQRNQLCYVFLYSFYLFVRSFSLYFTAWMLRHAIAIVIWFVFFAKVAIFYFSQFTRTTCLVLCLFESFRSFVCLLVVRGIFLHFIVVSVVRLCVFDMAFSFMNLSINSFELLLNCDRF